MPGNLASFRRSLNNFSDRLLSDYTRGLRIAPRPKEINDPIWHTISLTPLEVLVVDSPIFQRLRLIRQLGVAHYVYPGAVHTRFEHCVGCVHQAQTLLHAINHQVPNSLTARQIKTIRLAALCHDLGHGFMSHVSENALSSTLDVKELLVAFADEQKCDLRKLSEVASFYIIGSTAFRDLIRRAKTLTGDDVPDNVQESMQNAVIGLPIDDSVPLLQELISGPFDADKLDYMSRDAKMAGVPVVTDTQRLTSKFRAIQIPAIALPEDVAKRVKGGKTNYLLTGIALSGGRTLDELILGRTLLFDKIYRHQKVRAVECMVANLMESLCQLKAQDSFMLPFEFNDDNILSLTMDKVELWAGRTLTRRELRVADLAVDISKRLRDRDLFVRAFAFAQSMPLDPYKDDFDQKTGLRDAAKLRSKPDLLQGCLKNIVAETYRALEILGRTSALKKFPNRKIDGYIALSPPELPKTGNEVPRAFLIGDDNHLIRFSTESGEARRWADAYLFTNELGYIFTDRAIAQPVFFAAEKVFRMRFNVRIPVPMLSYAKQNPAQLRESRLRLARGRFYDGCPNDLLPVAERLEMADVKQTISLILQNLSGYHGPTQLSTERAR